MIDKKNANDTFFGDKLLMMHPNGICLTFSNKDSYLC